MHVIQCSGLTKRFGMKTVLADIHLTVGQGGPVGVVGPNGAGKTTFFSILSGFLKPSSGEVRVLGEKPDARALKRRFTVLPQDADFPKTMTVQDTLHFFAQLQGFTKQEAHAEAKKVLEWVQLANEGSQHAHKLSHGMKKRLAIAQALMGEPALVLLDEPTAGLDPVSASRIRSLIWERRKRTTFMISSHQLNEIENLCDSVLIFNQGNLVKQDNLSELTSRAKVLSITFTDDVDSGLTPVFHAIPGVERATINRADARQLMLVYEASQGNQVQMEVMKILTEKNIAYREIKKGEPLEHYFADMT